MSEPKTKSTNPRDWPREWWHDPDFWRDVATRTIAGILAASFIFVMGLVGGYFQSPSNWPLFLAAGASILATAVIAFFAMSLMGVGQSSSQQISLDDAAAAIHAKRARRSRAKSRR